MTRPLSLDLAVIGNSNIAALIDRSGTIVWGCWPRLDGDPVFCALVDGNEPEAGFFSIGFDEEAMTAQSYVRNTAIVRTVVTAASGAAFAITDFAPRFRQHGRTFRPSMLIRRVEPLAGLCRIRVRARPRMDYGRHRATVIPGSNHIRYVTESSAIRLSTDAPVTYIAEESAFVLTQPLTFILHPDESFAESILVLSSFAGASRELSEALIVNPYDTHGMAEALGSALRMSVTEQRDRMRLMRDLVRQRNVYRWAAQMLLDAARLRRRMSVNQDTAEAGRHARHS